MTAVAPAEVSDLDVIARVLAGDHRAFAVLVRRYNQRLFRAARAITRSDVDAEDVLQQSWLEIFRHLGQFRGDAAFATWATRITVNAAITHSKKRSLLVEVTDESSEADTPVPAAMAPIDRIQLGALLERCLGAIPQGHREVMVLRDVLELDTAETAHCLGLTEEAVRVRLHRARAAVAGELTERLGAHARDVYSFDGARCDRVTAFVMRNVLALASL
jgi:RNA polymerase sigma-70 factor, ECF subfamily